MIDHRMLFAASLMAVSLFVGTNHFIANTMAQNTELVYVVAKLEPETTEALAEWEKMLT